MSDCIVNIRIFGWHLQFYRSTRKWGFGWNDYHWHRDRRWKTLLLPFSVYEFDIVDLVKP